MTVAAIADRGQRKGVVDRGHPDKKHRDRPTSATGKLFKRK